jgi:hypothetical protein
MRHQTKFIGLLILLFTAIFIQASSVRPRNRSADPPPDANQGKVVYVCACLKTKSCSCMTEAKMEGPCACGTEGGPPMKAVPRESDWAKENREQLAK